MRCAALTRRMRAHGSTRRSRGFQRWRRMVWSSEEVATRWFVHATHVTAIAWPSRLCTSLAPPPRCSPSALSALSPFTISPTLHTLAVRSSDPVTTHCPPGPAATLHTSIGGSPPVTPEPCASHRPTSESSPSGPTLTSTMSPDTHPHASRPPSEPSERLPSCSVRVRAEAQSPPSSSHAREVTDEPSASEAPRSKAAMLLLAAALLCLSLSLWLWLWLCPCPCPCLSV
mmetsp:Transcript_23012/g.54528  ORF Transcript_23012/g.54528 Transcript_23012/m.54528 type:complete len:229 (-) Transcript_23012:222-908(-)